MVTSNQAHRRLLLSLMFGVITLASSMVVLLACYNEREIGDGTITEPSAPWIQLALLPDDEGGWGPVVTLPANTWRYDFLASWSADYTGGIELSIEGVLPLGVTAVFDPPVPFATHKASYSLTVTATPDAPAATTNVTIRARGKGVSDATVVLQLKIVHP
jgi:hypothetical protein